MLRKYRRTITDSIDTRIESIDKKLERDDELVTELYDLVIQLRVVAGQVEEALHKLKSTEEPASD